MDELFLKILQSVWPVLVPTVTIILSYLELRKRQGTGIDETTKNRAMASSGFHELKQELKVLDAEVRLTIAQAVQETVNGKLDRIMDKVDALDDRVKVVEVNVGMIQALSQAVPKIPTIPVQLTTAKRRRSTKK